MGVHVVFDCMVFRAKFPHITILDPVAFLSTLESKAAEKPPVA